MIVGKALSVTIASQPSLKYFLIVFIYMRYILLKAIRHAPKNHIKKELFHDDDNAEPYPYDGIH
jgi:hypothetical protein